MPEDSTLTDEEREQRRNEERALIIKEIDTAIGVAKKAFVKPANEAIAKLSKKGKQWSYPLAFALLENMKAQQVAQEPNFIADPRNDDGEMIKPVIEKLLSHYAEELNMRQMAEEASDWVGWTGLAVAKTGYTVLLDDTVRPFAMSFDPRNFFTDTYCTKTDLSDARYCGDVQVMPKRDALNDPANHPDKINDIPVNKVGADYTQGEDDRFERVTELPESYGLLTLRELHIRNRETREVEVCGHAEGQEDFYRDLAPLPKPFKRFNYFPLVFFPVPGMFYGQSILVKVEATCNQLDKAMIRIQERWEKSPEKFIVNEQNLGKAGLDAVKNSSLFNFVPVRDGSARDAVDFLHGAIIYSDEMSYLNYLVELFQWISGMTYMQLGSGSSRTATEAGLVGQSADMRSSRRMSVMERWMSAIGKQLWIICRYNRKFLPVKEILGEKLTEQWEKYEKKQSERERMANDTDITVRMSMPINTAAIYRRDKNLEFLRRIADPGIQQALAAQGKILDVDAILGGIAHDNGYNKPITIDMPKSAAVEGEA